MKKALLTLVVLATTIAACNNNPTAQPAAAAPAPAPTPAAVYEGQIKETLWEDKNVPMRIVLDKAAGTFTLTVDYNNNLSHEGEKVVDINDSGAFKVVQDAKWGEIFELSGKTTGTSLYQNAGAKIKEIDHEKMNYTGQELDLK